MQTFGNAQPAGGTAQVRFGVYNQQAPVAGKTVGQIRQQYGNLWGIPQDANAFVGKNKVDDNYVMQPGDNLEYHRRAGEKGA